MKSGGKYQPLFDYLRQAPSDEVKLTLAEIESLLGKPLPPSAKTRRDWWGNRRGALQASAWMAAGYHVVDFDPQAKEVIFRKPLLKYVIRREGDTLLWNGELVKALRHHLGFSQIQFASELGVRQQTISEWENEIYAPSRATCKYLSLVAERANFPYLEETRKTD